MQVKIGLGRSNVVVTVALFLFLGGIVGAGVVGGLRATETSPRVLGYAVAALFAVPLLMLLRALPKFLSPRYVVFDAAGTHIVAGKEEVVVPWPAIAAIGIGYEYAARAAPKVPTSVDGVKEAVTNYLTDQAMEALQVSGQRRFALEIYPVAPGVVEQFPRLKPYWKAERPPVPGLAPARWRYALPPVTSIAQEIARGAQTFGQQRWLGWIPRPWSAG